MIEPANRLRASWAAAIILVFGTALRFWQLGDFPFHHDEAMHAWGSLDVRAYHYDPIYHGPLLYHLCAAAFAVLGINDFSARFVPAALGGLLLWMVLYPARRYLGVRAALWSGGLLAVSPVVVTYSRRLLHDSLVLVLTLGAVLCFQAALEHPSASRAGRNARLGLVALLALFLATKANVVFTVAMLGAFWIYHWLTSERTKRAAASWDLLTCFLCLGVALIVFALLFRADTLQALPAMIHYWGGQQRQPRLPGPDDYYLRLLLLYELPVFLAAIWGVWSAGRRSAPFINLLLWWAFTSLALYAVANEKVPWLLVHQVLPLALLGGCGLARIEMKTRARRFALGAATALVLVFALRHVHATNFERAADRHEPLFYAQTTEAYRDDLLRALAAMRPGERRSIWMSQTARWPATWYARPNPPQREDRSLADPAMTTFLVSTEIPPPEAILGLVLLSPEKWNALQATGQFHGWKWSRPEHLVWPRPAWSALWPQTFARFWLSRETSGLLAEDFSAHSVIATP